MRKHFFFAAAAALALCFASCQKEETGLTRFSACVEQDAKTVVNGQFIEWQNGDNVKVWNNDYQYDRYIGTPRQDDPTWADFVPYMGSLTRGPYKACYPYEFYQVGDRCFLLYENQESVDGRLTDFPMYAESEDGETFQFKNVCGVVKVHLEQQGVEVSKIRLYADKLINGYYQLELVDGVPTLMDDWRNGMNTEHVTLELETPQSIAGGHDFYIFLPPSGAEGYHMTLTVYKEDGTYCDKHCSQAIVVERSKITNISVSGNMTFVDPLPDGVLPGYFSVSASKQVRFAKGNLKAEMFTNPYNHNQQVFWEIQEHQYDMVGEDNHPDGKCDLFGWSTDATYFGMSSSTTSSDYSGSFVDWGTQIGADWRTLTKDEWNYLLYERDNASSKRAHGFIGWSEDTRVRGYIILPDNFTLPDGCTFTVNENGFVGRYTYSEWERMEAAGALFLPASGYRWGDVSVTDINDLGFYWSSTPDPDDPDRAWTYRINWQFGNNIYNIPRNYTGSVRLAYDPAN